MVGLVVGIGTYYLIESPVRVQMIEEAKTILNLASNENFGGINMIKNGLMTNFFLILLIYFAAFTFIPYILIHVITFVKGAMLGSYIPLLFTLFGTGKGLLAVALFSILPNMIYVLAYLYLCNNSLLFHHVIKEGMKVSDLFMEIIKIVIAFSFILISIIIEQMASYLLISMYLGI